MSKVRGPQGDSGARRKEGRKPRASTATSGAKPKTGFEVGHAAPSMGARKKVR
jgi:hypothetical protein